MSPLEENSLGPGGAEITAKTESGEVTGSVIIGKKGKDKVNIGYIRVKPEHRHQGWGDQLLTAAEQWAIENGATAVVGTARPEPGTGNDLQSMLTKHGFEIDKKTGKLVKKI